MNVHKNARLTPRGRERIVRQVESGQTPEAVAEAAGVCPRTVRKWIDRYRREGLAGLQDRSSRPHRLRQPTPQPVVDEIERLRRQRWTGKEIAAETGVSPATVSRVLRRLGLNKLSALEPAEPIRRYERQKPGELIHLDIKKLGRIDSVVHRITGRYPGVVNRHHGIGWEFVHVAYARAYHSSDQRSADLSNWLHRYNWHRPHGSLKANTPISRGLSEDNLLRLHN
jgi:transposase